MKHAAIQNSQLVAAVVGVMVLIIGLNLGFNVYKKGVNTDKDDVILCQEAVVNQAMYLNNLKVAGISLPSTENAWRLNCPITRVNVSLVALQKVTTADKQKMTNFGYDPKQVEKYNLDKIVYTQARNCYKKAMDGQNPLFGNKLALSYTSFCAICSLIELDEQTQTSGTFQPIESGARYFFKEQIKAQNVDKTAFQGSFPQFMIENSVDDTFRYTDTTYPTNTKRIAVIFVRTTPAYGKDYVAYSIKIGHGMLNTFVNAFNFYTGRPTGTIIPNYTLFPNQESVRIVAYEDAKEIAKECEILVNQFED